MSNPESAPVTPSPYPPATVAAPVDRWRWLLAGLLGILGGYLTVSMMTNGVIFATLARPDALDLEVVVPWVLQTIFGLAVTSFAFFAAPGPLGRRVLAVVLFIVLAVVLFLVTYARLFGAVRGAGPVLLVLGNPYWVVLVAGGLGWLIAVGARPVAYLTLALTLIVAPLGFIFALANVASGLSTIVQLAVSLAVAVVILFASRPAATSTASEPTLDRWRWLLAGVIGIVGGYLTLGSLTGGLMNVLVTGQDWETTLHLAVRGVFALVVTAIAFFAAPGPLRRRVLAVVLFVVISIALLAWFTGRISGVIRFGGVPLQVITNAYSVVLFVGGLGWLIAAGARPLAYLSLLPTFIVMPLAYIFVMNNIGYGVSSIVQLLLSLVIAVVILLVSRPAAPATPLATPDQPSESAAELAPTAFEQVEQEKVENVEKQDDAPPTPAP